MCRCTCQFPSGIIPACSGDTVCPYTCYTTWHARTCLWSVTCYAHLLGEACPCTFTTWYASLFPSFTEDNVPLCLLTHVWAPGHANSFPHVVHAKDWSLTVGVLSQAQHIHTQSSIGSFTVRVCLAKPPRKCTTVCMHSMRGALSRHIYALG